MPSLSFSISGSWGTSPTCKIKTDFVTNFVHNYIGTSCVITYKKKSSEINAYWQLNIKQLQETIVKFAFTLEIQTRGTQRNLNKDDTAFNVMYLLFFNVLRIVD